MNPEPNPRQLRWLLCAAAAAVAITLGALVALAPADSSADWLRLLGRFHPLFVHLPIGVVLLVAAAEVASVKPGLRASIDPVITPVLVTLVASALCAFVAGLLLARGGGYPDGLLLSHKRLATAGMFLLSASLVAWALQRHRASSRWRNGYRAVLGLGVVALGAGAHFGGSMTHGEAYLVRFAPQPIAGWFGVSPRTKAVVAARAPAAEPEVHAHVVQPVLAKYCVDCHGPDKAKGDLRLDSYAAIMKGGDAGPAIVPRAPEQSRLVTLLRLPLEDIDHMPPQGKPQPSQAQVELIVWWILRGAHEHERVREVLPPAAVVELLKDVDAKAAPSIAPKAPEPESD